jgi:hypothetical protein
MPERWATGSGMFADIGEPNRFYREKFVFGLLPGVVKMSHIYGEVGYFIIFLNFLIFIVRKKSNIYSYTIKGPKQIFPYRSDLAPQYIPQK